MAKITGSPVLWLCVIVAVALLAGGRFLFQWHYQSLLARPVLASTDDLQALLAAHTPPPPSPLVSPDALSNLALMGQRRTEAVETPPALEDIPETTQMLGLSGVFASQHGGTAAALIQVDGSSPNYFTLGSEVTPGTYLYAVANDGVTLKSDEGFEKLVFKRGDIWARSTANNIFVSRAVAPPPPSSPVQKRPVIEQPGAMQTAHRLIPEAPQIADGSLDERLLQIRDALKR